LLSLLNPGLAQATDAELERPKSADAAPVNVAPVSEAAARKQSIANLDVDHLIAAAIAEFILVAEALPTAQSPDAATAAPANSRLISPRFGAGYTTDGGSHSRLGRLEGFVPLWQEAGATIGFLEGRLVLGDNDDMGRYPPAWLSRL
jgi:hypothetical protein